MAAIAGIGFTVSIFVAGLAFDDPASPTRRRSACCIASVVAALLGAAILRHRLEGRRTRTGGSDTLARVLHLRLTVPSRDAPQILEGVRATAGVAHVAHLPAASAEPGGDLILCDVAREAAGGLVDWLQEQRVHHDGAITITAGRAP